MDPIAILQSRIERLEAKLGLAQFAEAQDVKNSQELQMTSPREQQVYMQQLASQRLHDEQMRQQHQHELDQARHELQQHYAQQQCAVDNMNAHAYSQHNVQDTSHEHTPETQSMHPTQCQQTTNQQPQHCQMPHPTHQHPVESHTPMNPMQCQSPRGPYTQCMPAMVSPRVSQTQCLHGTQIPQSPRAPMNQCLNEPQYSQQNPVPQEQPYPQQNQHQLTQNLHAQESHEPQNPQQMMNPGYSQYQENKMPTQEAMFEQQMHANPMQYNASNQEQMQQGAALNQSYQGAHNHMQQFQSQQVPEQQAQGQEQMQGQSTQQMPQQQYHALQPQAGDNVMNRLITAANAINDGTMGHKQLHEAMQMANELYNYTDPNLVENIQKNVMNQHQVAAGEPAIRQHCHCVNQYKKAAPAMESEAMQAVPNMQQKLNNVQSHMADTRAGADGVNQGVQNLAQSCGAAAGAASEHIAKIAQTVDRIEKAFPKRRNGLDD